MCPDPICKTVGDDYTKVVWHDEREIPKPKALLNVEDGELEINARESALANLFAGPAISAIVEWIGELHDIPVDVAQKTLKSKIRG